MYENIVQKDMNKFKVYPQRTMYLNLSNSILNYKCVFFLIQDMSEVDVVKNHFEVSASNTVGKI